MSKLSTYADDSPEADEIRRLAVPPFGGIGDTMFAAYAIDAALTAGDLVDGADLRVGDPLISITSLVVNFPDSLAFPITVGTPLEGTWRACQSMVSASDWTNAMMGYFIRIA